MGRALARAAHNEQRRGSGPRGFTYDLAGNAVALLYPTGKTVTQEFDALNRLVTRVVPERTYPKTRCQGFPTGPISATGNGPNCPLVFPYYPNDGTGLELPADTSTFAYDAVGNTLTANNRYARVKRSYTLRGLVSTDSLIFGSYATPSLDAERRGQVLSYDRDGRRTSMAWALGTTDYSYHPFGAPQQVTDPPGNTYRFVYDLQGRVDSLVVAASGGAVGVREQRTYDDDGRLTRRERVSAALGQLLLDSLFYDQRDKVARARSYSRAQATEGVALTHDPHGAVVAQERTRDAGGSQVEEFRNDAYGNVFYARTRSSAGGNDAPFVSSYAPDGAMLERHAVLPAAPSQNQREESVAQTAVGSDVERTGRLVTIPAVNGGGYAEQMAGRQYYSSDGRLAVLQRYDYLVGSGDDVGTWEEYRYDALGRRVLTRARRDLSGAPADSRFLCRDLTNGSCGSYVERALWDGDQLLYEWRSAEATPTGMTDGSAGYVHAEGLDQPVAVLRPDGARVVSYTWRGLGESSVFVSGAAGDCSLVVGSCALPAVDWPGKTQSGVYFTPNVLASGPSGPRTWFGGLAANGGGSGGLLFRRNRFFDPATGQFTQEDPIGLAGGLNLYGFAAGDPVNYSDPFGLCPIPVLCEALDIAAVAMDIRDIRRNGLGWGNGIALAADMAAVVIPVVPAVAGAGERAAVKGADFVVSARGTAVPTSQSRMRAGFDAAGFPSQPTSSPGIEHTLPSGMRVRTMEPSGGAPRRASFENANGGRITPDGTVPQPPRGMTRAERADYIRKRTHVEQHHECGLDKASECAVPSAHCLGRMGGSHTDHPRRELELLVHVGLADGRPGPDARWM